MFGTAHFYWGLALAAGVLAVGAAYQFLVSARRDRIFSDTPLVRIRSAAQGYVHVEGRAGPPPDASCSGPLSGIECVWWDYRIEERQQDSRGNTSWHEVDSGASVAPFTLDDGDARCLVGPVGAEIIPTTSQVWYGAVARPLGIEPPASQVITTEQRYRYRERRLAVGARLSVLGELRSHSEVSDTNEQTRKLLADWKRDQPRLLERFDRDHDGRIDSAEWDAARAAAQAEVLSGQGGSSVERISVIAQCSHGEPFLIAPLDERALVRREKLHATLALVASLLLAVGSLWAVYKARGSTGPRPTATQLERAA